MRLEEIMPEARKGRKVKLSTWTRWHDIEQAVCMVGRNALGDDWELGPEVTELCLSGIKITLGDKSAYFAPQYGPDDEDGFYLGFDDIDTLKAAADKARGVEDEGPVYVEPPTKELVGMEQSAPWLQDRRAFLYQSGWNACWEAVKRLREGK